MINYLNGRNMLLDTKVTFLAAQFLCQKLVDAGKVLWEGL